MQTIEQFAGKDGKRGMIVKSVSGEKVCLDWYAYGKDGKLIGGGDNPVMTEADFAQKYEAAKSDLDKAIN